METIYLGLPVLETFKAQTVVCLLQMFDYWRQNPVFKLKYSVIIGSRQIHFARNGLVRAGQEAGMDYMAFIDADMTFPQNVLHKLYFASKDICGVLYKGRIKPHPYNVFYFKDEGKEIPSIVGVDENWVSPKSQLFEADGVGSGVILIRKRVFQELPTPWFFYEKGHSEDIMFCMLAKKHGFKVHIHTEPRCGHVGDEVFI